MKKVITYGTYDYLHYGHIRLLERAKALGDYLIVGVTADDFDKTRGKINVRQSLIERVEAVRATGLADEIIVEEFEGQKIDDIRKYGVDIFAIGSDWEGKFDYLSEYCKVVYLPRTEGVSSSEIRSEEQDLRILVVGEHAMADKFIAESAYVNGVSVSGCISTREACEATDGYKKLLDESDAVYVVSEPMLRSKIAKAAILSDKHVLIESPIATSVNDCRELHALAKERGVIVFEALKTAFSTAYHRLNLLVKGGKIGKVVSVDAVCTSLTESPWGSLLDWGATTLLPIFQLLGTDYREIGIHSLMAEDRKDYDVFTKLTFVYDGACASAKVGNGVKSEGELIISGTKGYIYVPAPWWKTDYFEVRFEHAEDNKRYFYQLEGEGIRYEILEFLNSVRRGTEDAYVTGEITEAICGVMERCYEKGERKLL